MLAVRYPAPAHEHLLSIYNRHRATMNNLHTHRRHRGLSRRVSRSRSRPRDSKPVSPVRSRCRFHRRQQYRHPSGEGSLSHRRTVPDRRCRRDARGPPPSPPPPVPPPPSPPPPCPPLPTRNATSANAVAAFSTAPDATTVDFTTAPRASAARPAPSPCTSLCEQAACLLALRAACGLLKISRFGWTN